MFLLVLCDFLSAQNTKVIPKLQELASQKKMNEIKIPCPHCQGVVSFTDDAIGQIADCPHCSLTMTLNIPGQSLQPETVVGHKLEGDYAMLGLVMIIIGIPALCAYGAGILLIIFGAILYNGKKCSICSTKISNSAVICPACKCNF